MSKTIKDITSTQTVLNDDDYFELQENAGTSKKTLWSTIRNTIALFVGAGTTTFKQDSYVMLDNDGYSRIEVDTTAGAVAITLPLMANNTGREITIAFVKNDASADVITISPHATDANKLSNDGLASIILPKVGDFVTLKQSDNSGFWEITNERITSQMTLDTYAGYGNVNNNKIPYFTNVTENVGNCHTLTSNNNTTGCVITINRSGKYSLGIQWYGPTNSANAGISKNSSQLTASYFSINLSDRVFGSSMTTTAVIDVSVTKYFIKGDVLRFHTDGNTPAITTLVQGFITYLGN